MTLKGLIRKKGKMKKNLTTSAYLTEDILMIYIFSHLPKKSLLRFKCVCKRWTMMISYHLLVVGPSAVACIRETTTSQTTFSDTIMRYNLLFISQHQNTPYILPILGMEPMQFKASCNGLLCALSNKRICVINPMTRENIWMPNPNNRKGVGLAFDPSTSSPHYRIVCPYIDCTKRSNPDYIGECRFDVFSSKRGVWNVFKAMIKTTYSPCDSGTVFAGGIMYWIVKDQIIWFHLDKDLAGVAPLPRNSYSESQMGEWKGMLTISQIGSWLNIDIWVMKDFCWIKMYSIDLFKAIRDSRNSILGKYFNDRNLRQFQIMDCLLRVESVSG